MKNLTVIDFFCGAGGFSEGFRQQGFEIKLGIDCWEPAIRTFNHNFGMNCSVKNILDFEDSVEEIDALPDTDIILGSPPCVTFSSSNISGKADKTLGIKLTEIFLRIVAVKKWKKDSKLKAWFMENVPSSRSHLNHEYTFEELGLAEWAKANRIGKNKVAIKLNGNQILINSANYGVAQSRKRVISGEIIKKKHIIIPRRTHLDTRFIKLKDILDHLPNPSCKKSDRIIKDPTYKKIKIELHQLTDHFYDTGLYKCEWGQSKFLKTNHPYMGKMYFPEDKNRPSRTIMATKIGTSREALIFRTEYDRKGDGEYRTPTIREAACLMSFPITYQFIGSENAKWRLVGNAVCPLVSAAFAKQVIKEFGIKGEKEYDVQLIPNLNDVNNLNSFTQKIFAMPPKRNKDSRFRRHPFKNGNITVSLSNYDIEKPKKQISKWITSVQYGNGEGFSTFNYPDEYFKGMEEVISQIKTGGKFFELINNGFSEKIGKGPALQEMYEIQQSQNGLLEPTELVEEIKTIIEQLKIENEYYEQNHIVFFKDKKSIPLKQIFALYAINKVSTIANSK
jgi:DNA (cytosine-5)-methyltransferase 1